MSIVEDSVKNKKHVSVVYFHGMGNQRRYEELSRLIDALDFYTTSRHKKDDQKLGFLADINPRTEKSRSVKGENITYIQALYKTKAGKSNPPDETVRFYEVYWAPILAEGISSYEVLKWMFSTILRPIQNLITPWRERQRLRKVSLLKLRKKSSATGKEDTISDYDSLFDAYEKFDKLDVMYNYPKGTVSEFQSFLMDKYKDDQDKVKRLINLTQKWRRYFQLHECWYLFLLLTLGSFLLIGFALSLALIMMLFQWITSVGLTEYLISQGLDNIAGIIKPDLGNAVTVLFGFLSFFGLTRFLSHYMGDVQQWTTYEETDTKNRKRREILKKSSEILEHVISDNNCGRVVVIGHSLGTAVANDTLLTLQRKNRAIECKYPCYGELPLNKIQHFITIGSPVDKIYYLFESFRTKYHRHRRVIDNLRGDIGTEPFTINNKEHIRWRNYWDQGDIVSGQLWTPSSGELLKPSSGNNRKLTVDNVEISQFDFPDPGSSHLAYFKDRKVIGDLYAIIFWCGYSLISSPSKPDLHLEYEETQPKIKLGIMPALYQKIALFLPYSLITSLVLRFVEVPEYVQSIAYTITGSLIFVLFIGYILSKIKGHLNPI